LDVNRQPERQNKTINRVVTDERKNLFSKNMFYPLVELGGLSRKVSKVYSLPEFPRRVFPIIKFFLRPYS